MTTRASGPFEVKMAPQGMSEKVESPPLGRFSLGKQYHGDLEATSQGEMLSGGTAVKGSAGYVAIEKVSGTLRGRSGSFILMHTGVMNRGTPSLSIIVVPDSGTNELAGLAGTMSINVVEKQHTYEFDYTLGEAG